MNPGTELGRYTVASRIEEIAGGERWTARDTTLDRDVTLLVMPTDGASTPAALDAARRAAGVEAAQLVRILDVDTEGDLSWVAEESLADALTYAEAIGTDGLPAEEVRRITGEIATGVEAARARGLHHLALTPDIVLLTHDGRVKVRGLATSAALGGTETEGEEADRDDARAIVALAYAGLTGTWPLPGSTSLPAAPTSDGAPTPPFAPRGGRPRRPRHHLPRDPRRRHRPGLARRLRRPDRAVVPHPPRRRGAHRVGRHPGRADGHCGGGDPRDSRHRARRGRRPRRGRHPGHRHARRQPPHSRHHPWSRPPGPRRRRGGHRAHHHATHRVPDR
ncbi:hypothetical protein B277_15649 [Janibacter hoylei PVAS-1]|uniref:Protein kinase domain-containing protein n=1 Tax=Janibacter hoylei PVAS-1 TaxID=1210046 RepID=K1E3I9_9MICO|nr:hypothetical protein [Janibacter hoylei]EKA59927.1 hypothetical protein B277_15649 [Janibacter hoylei PVAS-1]